MRAVAKEIAGAGVSIDPWVLVILGKLLRVETSIKAGSYELSQGINALGLLLGALPPTLVAVMAFKLL